MISLSIISRSMALHWNLTGVWPCIHVLKASSMELWMWSQFSSCCCIHLEDWFDDTGCMDRRIVEHIVLYIYSSISTYYSKCIQLKIYRRCSDWNGFMFSFVYVGSTFLCLSWTHTFIWCKCLICLVWSVTSTSHAFMQNYVK